MNKELIQIVNHQAELQTLWSEPVGRLPTLAEATLKYALRHLHAVIEGDMETAEICKREYWNIESEI